MFNPLIILRACASACFATKEIGTCFYELSNQTGFQALLCTGEEAKLRQEILIALWSNPISTVTATTQYNDNTLNFCVSINDNLQLSSPISIVSSDRISDRPEAVCVSIDRITQPALESRFSNWLKQSENLSVGVKSNAHVYLCLVTDPSNTDLQYPCYLEQIGTEQPRPLVLKVLLAEDSYANQLAVKSMIESLGHTVECVDNGSDAYDRACSSQYDVIILDEKMPGCNGSDVARKLRDHKNGQHQPYLASLTGLSEKEEHSDLTAAGFNEVITKPVRKAQLNTLLQTVIDHQGTHNEQE